MEWWLPWAEGWRKWEDVGQNVHTSGYNISKFGEPNVHHDEYC